VLVNASVPVFVAPPYTPEMFTETAVPPESVVTVNVAERVPAATVALAGTVALTVLELVSVTKTPPVGATPLSATVPVEVAPCITLVGLRVTA
jgi:hypothetical protein